MDSVKSVVFFIYAVLAGSVGAVIGASACIAQPCVEYVIAGVQVFYTRPSGLPAREHVYSAPADGDPARSNYFYGLARSDLRYVRQVAWSRWRNRATWWQETVIDLLDSDDNPPALMNPVAIGMAAGLILALPVGALLAAAVGLMHEIAVDVATAGVRCAATTLKVVDSGILYTRHIQVRCVACFERMPYPAYLCPNPECEHIHWDIRPGRYGILRRTCTCGTRMPTALLLGSAQKLDAICAHRACRHPLEYGPGEEQEIILPIFGSKGAGKTLLLRGIIKTLCQSGLPGVHVTVADSATGSRLDDLDSALAKDSAVPATPAVRPRAYVLRMRIGRRRRIVQLHDTAGELFYDSERSADLTYLGAANTFVLVIDPLSIGGFWNWLPSAARDQFAPDRSAAPHPELAYQQTAERITEMGKPRARHRLAIVFSRADLLGKKYGPQESEGAEVRNWAVDSLGLTALLRQAESDFREVAFFHTAAFGGDENSLRPLIQWILRAEGVIRRKKRSW